MQFALAHSEYENDYSEYYDDYDDDDHDLLWLFEVISQYHNMEMKEKRELNKLHHELDLDKHGVKALLRKYKTYKKMHH